MAKKQKPLLVIDPNTGKTGILEETPGYLAGGSHYVNPGWRIIWDKDNDGKD